MDPKVKEKHEDSKKETETGTTSHYIKNHKITSVICNQAEELKVMMKNYVRKTYE